MSDFGKALRREFGKNTGKFISNVVFGDKHSTPYRRVEAARQERQANINARHADRMRMQQDRLRIQEKRLQLQQERQEKRDRKNELREREVEIKESMSMERKKNQLYSVDSAINSAIDNLLSTPIPTDIPSLEQYILDLHVQVNAANSDGFRDEREIRKKYFIALRERFFQAFNKLELLAPNSYVLDDYIVAYEDLQYKKYCDANPDFKSALKFARLTYILKRNVPSTSQRLEHELETLIYFTQTYQWSKLATGYKVKALDRAKMDAERLAGLNSDNPFVDIVMDYERALRNSKRKKRFSFFCGAGILIFVILCLIYGKIFFWLCVIIGLIIPISFFSVKYYQRTRNKIEPRKQTENERIVTEKKPDNLSDNISDDISQDMPKDMPKDIPQDISDDFSINLNQQNRISDTLNSIWTRYKNQIPPTIYARSPIFATEGIKDSILFVGVNPSYIESDDEVLKSTDNHKSLSYGSFYKKPGAPEYYNKLEEFASELGYAYSHMNLLYLRENDRNIIATLNSEFIREQLELTYQTILCLNPIAIIFMSDWCRLLIDGPGRWVDSEKGLIDNLTLNGTTIPVFFSEDISILNTDEKNALSRQVRIRLLP